MIFNKLASMDQETFYKNKKHGDSKDRTFSNTDKKRLPEGKRREYGPNVGKEGGNP